MCVKLSFIIPTYDCAEFLDETFGSVLSQLPDSCELIAVDDGSTDGTLTRLADLEERCEGLRLISVPHGGASKARNAGLEAAKGEWVCFMDCDDCLKPDFFEKAMPLLDDGTDLYVFSFERVDIMGSEELVAPLMVADRIYETASDYADEYIRSRHLLVYSACNKFYRKSLLDKHGIRFRDGMSFGEDRLFNYDYLMRCGRIATSSVRMFRYMQRNPDSASKRHYPDYFNTIMMLHRAKMECFLTLSKGTTGAEKRAFTGYDLSTEVSRLIDRFADHPEEKEENLPHINRLLFGEPDDISGRYDVIIVLGSRDCGYRAGKAFDVAAKDPETTFLVTGGNTHKDGVHTEAGFMREYLEKQGVAPERIMTEDIAENTFRNLELSAAMIDEAAAAGRLRGPSEDLRIGIVTAGFHIPRTRLMLKNIPWYDGRDVAFIPAYGRHTRPDNWYCDPHGRVIGLSEIAKCCCVSTEEERTRS